MSPGQFLLLQFVDPNDVMDKLSEDQRMVFSHYLYCVLGRGFSHRQEIEDPDCYADNYLTLDEYFGFDTTNPTKKKFVVSLRIFFQVLEEMGNEQWQRVKKFRRIDELFLLLTHEQKQAALECTFEILNDVMKIDHN
jgi:hypothetical protein